MVFPHRHPLVLGGGKGKAVVDKRQGRGRAFVVNSLPAAFLFFRETTEKAGQDMGGATVTEVTWHRLTLRQMWMWMWVKWGNMLAVRAFPCFPPFFPFSCKLKDASDFEPGVLR